MKITFLLLFFALSMGWASDSGMSISFGPVKIGENRLPIHLNDFNIVIKSSIKGIKVDLIEGSTQWVRMSGNLLTPRARVNIKIPQMSQIHLRYSNRSILPLDRGKYLESEIYLSLFDPADVDIYSGSKKIGAIEIHSHSSQKEAATHVIDYSCSRHNLIVKGLDEEYLSVGCSKEILGSIGSEHPRLEVYWASPNFRLLDGSSPPYLITFNSSGTIKTTVVNKKGQKRVISISATLPKRFHRLKTALGLGPYSFKSEYEHETRPGRIAPALMLYGNLQLPQQTSIRMFDALVAHQSVFNNFGFYFAYEIASAFDNHISLVPLLGIQGLTFKYDNQFKNYSKMIYPQGFEVSFRNPFGLTNYSLVYGMFIKLGDNDTEDYKNIWLRFGKKVFYEINYIDWLSNNKRATMWGLSIGFPFVSLF